MTISSLHIQLFLLLFVALAGLVLFIYQGVQMVQRQKLLTRYGIHPHRGKQNRFERLFDSVANSGIEITQSNESEMKDKLISAGFYNTRYANFITPIKYIVFLCGAGGFYLLYATKYSTLTVVCVVAIWFILTTIAPDVFLNSRKQALQRKLSSLLPYVSDLLAICVQSGMTIEAAVRYLSSEFAAFDQDLSFLLKRLNDNAKVIGMAQALDSLYQDVPTPEFRSFVMTLKQSLRYGASIYKILTTLAEDIRQEQMLVMEEKIGKLGSKMSVPLILFVMLPVVVLIAAPGLMRIAL